jgi:aspartate kinase
MITRVLKFGGSSFPNLQSYNDIARYLMERLRTDSDRLVVVVSAMSGTTGRLQDVGLEINGEMSPTIADSLLATGEIVAACLMRAALEARGIKATHLTGFQLGLVTDSKFTRAQIKSFDNAKLLRALKKSKVVVVAGGQAVNDNGEMTMLGRNSSDLTAVAIAGALACEECEIFSDVPGVYSADPYQVEEAQLIPHVPFELIVEMSRSGAKVLHHGSVEQAMKLGIQIICRSIHDGFALGTVIGLGLPVPTVSSNSKILALQFVAQAHRLSARSSLERDGIIAIEVDTPEALLLCVSQENRAWETAVKNLPVPGQPIPQRTLVSLHAGLNRTERYCVPSDTALDLVKNLHAEYWTRSGPAPRLTNGKSRSQHSRLLA